MSLSGQWIASYSGSNKGTIVLDIDALSNHYHGVACVWDDDPLRPSTLASFRTSSKDDAHVLNGIALKPMDRAGNFIAPKTILDFEAAGLSYPKFADVTLKLLDDMLSVSWTTSVGTHGSAKASRSKAAQKSELVPLNIASWQEFKHYCSGIEPKKFIFRGQENNAWRLRTSFYRTGRANLEKYFLQDVAALNKSISALALSPFDLNNRLHYAAFLNLVQHHGYPTPLLDWTWSPYVAAFFAFRKINPFAPPPPDRKIRIFKLDADEWNKLPRFDKVFPVIPNISILDALAYNNPRAIPQQSISTASNLDDLEGYFRSIEDAQKKTYLEVIDLPAVERPAGMRELALMGVTAGALFPGIDGACESLKELNF